MDHPELGFSFTFCVSTPLGRLLYEAIRPRCRVLVSDDACDS